MCAGALSARNAGGARGRRRYAAWCMPGSSRPMLYLGARARSPRRSIKAPMSSSPGASPTLRSALGPLMHALALARSTTGTGSRAGTLGRAICSNAAARSPAAISPTRAFKNVPGMADLGYPIAEIERGGSMVVDQAARDRRPRRPPDRHRADALRDRTIRQRIWRLTLVLDITAARGRRNRRRPRSRLGRARQAAARHAQGHGVHRQRRAGRSARFPMPARTLLSARGSPPT